MANSVKEEGSADHDRYEHHRIVVDKGQVPIRIDKYVFNKVEGISRNKFQNTCKEGGVLVNEVAVKPNYKVRPLDIITISYKYAPNLNEGLIPEEIPLDIIYEDDHVMVINKQAGLVVHPGTGNHTGTLANGLVHYFSGMDLPIMEGNSKDRPGIVHRIDKDTTGLMVIAKTEAAIMHLSKQFYDHSIEREYVALVWGDVEEEKGTIVGNIGRHPTDRLQMFVYDEDEELGKHAVTHYEVEENLYYVSLVRCRLETGRTHQIRVHFKHLGHTLFNDSRYGGDRILKGTIFSKYRFFVENCFNTMPRQALHARMIGFVHPMTGEKMKFELEPPADFQDVVDRWRNYLNSRKELS